MDEVLRGASRAADVWRLPAPELVRVGMNATFVAGDVVLRVGRPTAAPEAALALAGVLAEAGVRVAPPARDDVVVDGGVAVTAWHRLVPTGGDADWADVGRMVALVHALDADALPADYPLPPCESFPWWDFDTLLPEVDPLLDPGARAGLVAAIERHRGWRAEDRVVCHGDVHPDNVMATASGTVLLDWDLLCAGPPAWDHSMLLRITRWGWPARWYDEFAAGYGRSLAGDPLAERIAELRLVAATLMRLRAARTDPAAIPEAQRRLEYWRGDPHAPPWTAA